MKFLRTSVSALLIFSLSALSTGCFGSFQLTRNFYEWHDSAIDNKFLKSLLFWFPFGFVYGITAMVDFVALNLIEFWSGDNPLSMNEGDYQVEKHTYAGNDYKIEATQNQFKITQLNGDNAGQISVVRFDTDSKTWFYVTENTNMALMSFEENGSTEYVSLYTPGGEKVKFDANAGYSQAEIASIYKKACENSLVASK